MKTNQVYYQRALNKDTFKMPTKDWKYIRLTLYRLKKLCNETFWNSMRKFGGASRKGWAEATPPGWNWVNWSTKYLGRGRAVDIPPPPPGAGITDSASNELIKGWGLKLK